MKWNEMQLFQKVLRIIGIVCSVAALILAVLSMADVLSNGLTYSLLLLGVYNIVSGIENWKQQRGLAIFSFAVAAFLIISQVYIMLAK